MPVTNFIWDELSDNVLLETDENDVVTAAYHHRPEQFGELLSQHRNGVDRFFHYDGQHSTSDLTAGNQKVTDTFIYTAYGEEVARTGATTNPFGYKGAVGYYTNESTNDIYVRNRSYEPATGRWLTIDPLGFVDGPNVYRAYFIPNGVDPNGTECAAKCTVKSFKVDIVQPSLRRPRGMKSVCFCGALTVDATFNEPCQCCEYRQWILLRESKLRRITPDGPGEWVSIPHNIREGVEDCDHGGCYGYRGNQRPPSDHYPNVCTYHGEDDPGYANVGAGIFELPVGHKREYIVKFRFLLRIVDICDKKDYERTVHSEIVDLFGQGVVTKTNVLDVMNPPDQGK